MSITKNKVGRPFLTNVQEAITALSPCKEIAIDLETGGLSPFVDPIAVVSLRGDNGIRAILHVRGAMPANLRSFLSEGGRLYIGHNITLFDLPFLTIAGVNICQWYDTLTIEALLDSQNRRDRSKSLKATVARRLGKDVPKSLGEHSWMKTTLTHEELQYCVDDIEYLIELKNEQVKKAQDTGQYEAVKLEIQIAPAILAMVINGLPIDKNELAKYISKQDQIIAAADATLRDTLSALVIHNPAKPGGKKYCATLSADSVNINSSTQLKAVYEAMGVDIASTDKEALNELAMNHEDESIRRFTTLLLEYKHASTRKNMYGEWLAKDSRIIVAGRVHAKYWQMGTATGRFSSSEPNLQQLPVDIRHIVRLAGHTVISVDYAAIEVRVAAAQAKDVTLLKALQSEDIHTSIASILFGIPRENVVKNQRQQAKAAVFCLIFGGGAGTLQRYARMYGQYLSLAECKNIVDTFFTRFTGLRDMRSRAYRQADTAGDKPIIISLPNGLRRILIGASAKATVLLNTSVQGTAALGLKYALLFAYQAGLCKYLCATVHDELVAIVPNDEAESYAQSLADCMLRGMYQVLPKEIFVAGEYIPVPITTGTLSEPYTLGDFWAK